jgi:hypothetical protein
LRAVPVRVDLGHLPGYDEALAALIRNNEGIPPLWFERLIAPWFYPLNLRPSDRLRRPPIDELSGQAE